MKKHLIFAPILLVIGIALFLLKLTGLPVHIAISFVGVAVMVAYTILTKKDWRIPALEIAARVCYGIALVTGIVIMSVQGVAAIAVIHKIFAALFVVSFAVILVHKLITDKKA